MLFCPSDDTLTLTVSNTSGRKSFSWLEPKYQVFDARCSSLTSDDPGNFGPTLDFHRLYAGHEDTFMYENDSQVG